MKPRRLLTALSCSFVLSALAGSCGRSSTDRPDTDPEPVPPDAADSGGTSTITFDASQPVPDAEPEPELCRDVICPALPHPTDPRFRYREHCCTANDDCGTGSEHVFGSACFEREQPGSP